MSTICFPVQSLPVYLVNSLYNFKALRSHSLGYHRPIFSP